jgi:polyhydroxyalkanoate synthesis regulator phasin
LNSPHDLCYITYTIINIVIIFSKGVDIMEFFDKLLDKQKGATTYFLDITSKALSTGFSVQESAKEVIDSLKKSAEEGEGSEGHKALEGMAKLMKQKKEQLMEEVTHLIEVTLEKMNIPTKEDFDKLNRKVQSLSAKLKKIEEPSKEREES